MLSLLAASTIFTQIVPVRPVQIAAKNNTYKIEVDGGLLKEKPRQNNKIDDSPFLVPGTKFCNIVGVIFSAEGMPTQSVPNYLLCSINPKKLEFYQQNLEYSLADKAFNKKTNCFSVTLKLSIEGDVDSNDYKHLYCSRRKLTESEVNKILPSIKVENYNKYIGVPALNLDEVPSN